MSDRRSRSSKALGPPRPPGRPNADAAPDARDALLDAAGRLFAEHGATGIPLSRIAREAGVTPAMIHYYFGSREGLYDAMLERTFQQVMEHVAAATGRVREESGSGAGGLGDVLDVVVDAFAAEPWIPLLVVREVLSEGGQFRERFIEIYASRMAALIPALMGREIDAGRFRDDLDPELAFLSFMGMTIMPFVARPVIERVLGVDYDAAFLRRFAAHTRKLFVDGASS